MDTSPRLARDPHFLLDNYYRLFRPPLKGLFFFCRFPAHFSSGCDDQTFCVFSVWAEGSSKDVEEIISLLSILLRFRLFFFPLEVSFCLIRRSARPCTNFPAASSRTRFDRVAVRHSLKARTVLFLSLPSSSFPGRSVYWVGYKTSIPPFLEIFLLSDSV